MLSKKGNPKDEVFNSSVVSKFGEPSQWNVEVLVRFKCGLEEAFGEEIFEVSDVLSPSEFAGKIAQIFAAQIKQSGGKFLLIKKRDRHQEVFASLKMNDVGFLRDGDVFEVNPLVSTDGQDASVLYPLVQVTPSNVDPRSVPAVSNSHSANPISVILNSHHASQQQYQQAQFYPPVPSFNNARSVTQPSPMFFSMPYNSGFRGGPPPMHPSVSHFFGGYAPSKPMVQQQIMPGQQQVMLGQQQVMPGQQQVMPDQQPSPSSLSHSWNNSWPAQSTFHQQQILRQQIKQEVEKQRQKQQQQLPSSSQTSVVSMAGSFSPPTNLVHLFIPAHWKNYPRILHGAIEEVLEGSRMQNEQKIEMRRVLIETIVNGRVPSESIQNSAIQIRKDMIFSYLDKVKANMICVLGEAQSAVPPDVSSKSYMELRKRKKAAVNAETQTRSLNGSDDPVLLKKVKLEPGTLDVGSAATDDDLYLETEPVLQVGALSGDRFATPDATSDCLLIVQGRSFHLNKGLLAVNSIVLREWLTNQVQLEVNDLDPKEFLQLMNFIYPSEEQCVITKENIETLLKLAARFQMAEVLKRCEKCLMDRSSAPQNTLAKQLYLAQEYGLVNLKDVCVKRCTSMSDLKSIQAEKEYKMLVDKTIVELVENITRNCC